MTPPAATAAAMDRFEGKLDALSEGMAHILERLAGIEATSKAEAAERATVNGYTRSAIEALQKTAEAEREARTNALLAERAAWEKALDAERQAREAAEADAVAGRRWAIGIAMGGLFLPIIVGLIILLISAGSGAR